MKTILFLTGTRADFGKLKPLIRTIHDHEKFDYRIFCTGMHMLEKYGNTLVEIKNEGFDNLFPCFNQMEGESMEIILANTITTLARFLNEYHVDMIVIHGDRIESLAGAITGSLRNILVAHVEGGELSGTIDDLMRHATTKLSHIHFVANETARTRLIQLGEQQEAIYNIGSPDIDVMFSDTLPSIDEVKDHYEISFENYAVVILHPVTTEKDQQKKHAHTFVNALIESGKNYVVIFPNNDLGSEDIFEAYENAKILEGHPRFRVFPSLRFEYFLKLLGQAEFIIGNSSAGIHEAPAYGLPTINIGTRQDKRFSNESIHDIAFDHETILSTIIEVCKVGRYTASEHYGTGKSAETFIKILDDSNIWQIPKQKRFEDLKILHQI
jgi:UDP-N-acetylglucosamine 2-epimerase (hydrolysing)